MKTTSTLLSLLLPVMFLNGAGEPHAALSTESSTRVPPEERSESRGEYFIQNRGQWDARAKFLFRSHALDLWVTSAGLVYDLRRFDRSDSGGTKASRAGSRRGDSSLHVTRSPVFMTFEGALPGAVARGTDRLAGYHNYFIGNDSAKWARNVPLFGGARLEGIYEGIDAILSIDHGSPRYDLMIAPGADPASIRMKFRGAGRLSIDRDGSMVIATDAGEIRQRELLAYQIIGGRKRRVECRFAMQGNDRVTFDLGRYDRAEPLVIDPLIYSTYLGGSRGDMVEGVAVDRDGNAYVTGTTSSADFPVVNAMQPAPGPGLSDAFVTQLNSSGSDLVYSTYIGGNDKDYGKSIAIDAVGNAYIIGSTRSTDFPTANAFQSHLGGGTINVDMFVAKIDRTGGALVYSTYLGGSGDEMVTARGGIAVDTDGNAAVTGSTHSNDFPVVQSFQSRPAGGSLSGDAFVTRFNSGGNALLFSTYLGGSDDDIGNGIAVDSSGNVYVTGVTTSTDFPLSGALKSTLGGVADAFVTKLHGSGALVYSTYLGGRTGDFGNDIAVDRNGSVFVIGHTNSDDFPTHDAYQPAIAREMDAFVCRLTTLGDAFVYSTYLGGSVNETGFGIAIDANGAAWVTGQTTSVDFPVLNAHQARNAGNNDVYVSRLSNDGRVLLHSTYLGGSDEENPYGIAIDQNGNVYVAGATSSVDFPTVNSYQQSNKANGDAFLVRISITESGVGSASDPSPMSGFRVQPNPMRSDAMHLAFILRESASVSVEIFGVDGDLLRRPIVGRRYDAGEHRELLDMEELPAGVYFLRVRAGGSERTARLVIER